MAMKFLDKRTGRIIEVLEPQELERNMNEEAAAFEAMGHADALRQARKIRVRAERLSINRRKLIDAMHKKFLLYERVADSTDVTPPHPKPEAPAKKTPPRAPKQQPTSDDD